MAEGATRKAEAIAAASKPSTTWRMSGARTPASMPGSAQANMSRRRSSGIPVSSGVPLSPPASSSSSVRSASVGVAASPTRRRRVASMSLRLATVKSQASGARGIPLRGQSASAAANASDSASSAPATSRVRAAR